MFKRDDGSECNEIVAAGAVIAYMVHRGLCFCAMTAKTTIKIFAVVLIPNLPQIVKLKTK